MDAIITELVRIQKEKRLSNSQMADILNVDLSYYYKLKAGIRNPGSEVLGTIMNAFPELILDVVHYVKDKGNDKKEVNHGVSSMGAAPGTPGGGLAGEAPELPVPEMRGEVSGGHVKAGTGESPILPGVPGR
jgi:hypothetical protein